MSRGAQSKFPLEKWTQAHTLFADTEHNFSIKEISDKVEIPYDTLYAYAKRKGWLNLKDIADTKRATMKLAQIIREIAGQSTDVHEHTIAMVEALQNSFKIMIIRDNEGHLHYQNMPPTWPNMPPNFAQMSPEDQDRELLSIDVPRLEAFIVDLLGVIKLKMDNISFITKMIKGSLPKIDPDTLDVSRRIGDATVDILATDDSRTLEEALNNDLKQLKAGD